MYAIRLPEAANAVEQIYDCYIKHTAMLAKEGYNKEEAFWINFACLPSIEHSAEREFQIQPADLFQYYSTIYNEKVLTPALRKTQSLNAEILRYKFLIIQNICSSPASSRQALELGYLLLPNVEDIYKQIHAGFLVIKEKKSGSVTLQLH